MAKSDAIEYEKRIRNVQEWIIDDWPSVDIINHSCTLWNISDRQAKRYIEDARSRWINEKDLTVEHKRKLKIIQLKKRQRSLKAEYKGTPIGLNALTLIEKQIIELEGLQLPKKIEVKTDFDLTKLPISFE